MKCSTKSQKHRLKFTPHTFPYYISCVEHLTLSRKHLERLREERPFTCSLDKVRIECFNVTPRMLYQWTCRTRNAACIHDRSTLKSHHFSILTSTFPDNGNERSVNHRFTGFHRRKSPFLNTRHCETFKNEIKMPQPWRHCLCSPECSMP